MVNLNGLVGRKFEFEDGNSIKVVQVKIRDENKPFVTYHIQQGPGIPRKLVMEGEEFLNTFGHLFKD